MYFLIFLDFEYLFLFLFHFFGFQYFCKRTSALCREHPGLCLSPWFYCETLILRGDMFGQHKCIKNDNFYFAQKYFIPKTSHHFQKSQKTRAKYQKLSKLFLNFEKLFLHYFYIIFLRYLMFFLRDVHHFFRVVM